MNEVLKALYDACMETQAVDKTTMDIKQYKADLQCAYDCGYCAGKALLDKIRAEIADLVDDGPEEDYQLGYNYALMKAAQIIDKYKAEGEGKECREHWIDNHNDTISCSHCHTWFYKDDRYSYMRYCPCCNTKMAESEDKG